MLKDHCRSIFGSCDVEKWHAAVARSTFASQNAKKLAFREHFWKLGCGKMARRCGEANLQVKMQKTPQLRSILGRWAVANLHAAVARSTCASQNVKNMKCSSHFLTCGRRKIVKKCPAAVAPSTLQVKLYKTLAFCTIFGHYR